ncbi:MAG: glycosyltransferase family 4 protein [Streptosporangiaceae bacterium]
MRIGLIAPPWVPVPPPAYGGTELVIDNLARGLKELGHDVVLFTVGESTCPVPKEYLFREPPAPIGLAVAESTHVLAAYDAMADVDLIHDHTLIGPLIAGSRGMTGGRRPPVVTTNHGPFTDETRRIWRQTARHASIICISHSQARGSGEVPVSAVIHHGIDLDVHQPGPGEGDYVMFIGRMSADKGVHHAVQIARKSGRRLVMATKMREAGELEYFNRAVRPLLTVDDETPTEMPLRRRLALLQDAAALVNPITWREPFGLVMAEALASGTPVLAFPNGAAPEIVDPGRTGFLCRDEDEMVEAIDRIKEIDRDECRGAAERRFSLQRMARDHERFYRRVLDREVMDRLPATGETLVSA